MLPRRLAHPREVLIASLVGLFCCAGAGTTQLSPHKLGSNLPSNLGHEPDSAPPDAPHLSRGAANPVIPPTSTWPRRCEPRGLDEGTRGSAPNNATLAVARRSWVLLTPEQPQICIGTNVHVFIADGAGGVDAVATRKALANSNGDADRLPVRAYLHFYTRSDANDGDETFHCKRTESTSCMRMERRLPLRYDAAAGVFVGRLVADPSSHHYAFEIRVASIRCLEQSFHVYHAVFPLCACSQTQIVQ